MDLKLAIIIFLIVLYVSSESRCGEKYRPTYRDYSYEGSVDSLSREIFPNHGRTHSVFKYQSPESWPFEMSQDTKASMLNAPRRGRVTAIPTVETQTQRTEEPSSIEQYNLRV